MSNAGAHVVVHDPKALPNAAKVYPNLNYEGDVLTALAGADLILHGTEWAEYRDLDPATVATVVRSRSLIDGRNILDPQAWRNAGFSYRALGRPHA